MPWSLAHRTGEVVLPAGALPGDPSGSVEHGI